MLQDLVSDVMVDQVVRNLLSLHVTPFLFKDVLYRQWFSSSVCQVVAGITQASTKQVQRQCWKKGQVGLMERLDQAVPFLP